MAVATIQLMDKDAGHRAAATMDLAPTSVLPYLPRHVAETIARDPGLDPVAREHRFRAAVLFADISGFTPMSEAFASIGPGGTEELTELLNRYFGAMIAVIESFGGSVAKFGGDAVTALFPAQRRERAAVRRAIQCALDMQALMPGYGSVTTTAGAFALSFKAGISVGDVLDTTVGAAGIRLEHVVAGDAIDRSVGAEHRAKAGEVVFHGELPAGVTGVELDSVGPLWRVEAQTPRSRHAPLHPLPAPDLAVARALAAYLHPAVAERIRAGRGRFSNEHRRVTASFVGFPDFDYRVPGVAWKLQSLLGPVSRLLSRLDGHLYQVDVGDKGTKAIACFGAPVAHGDDEERALRFALEVQRITPESRIGVAAGSAFFGEIGGPTRREYAAIGDTLNLAARLMQAAHAGQILVSGVSERILSAGFAIERLDPITVKGKSAAVPLVEVRGLTSIERTPPETPGTRPAAAMVDRRAETRRIRRRLEASAAAGPGRVLTITGEAGVGKSRLIVDIEEVARGLGMSVFAGSCQSHGSRTPYLPWHGLLRSLFGLDPASPVADLRNLLSDRLFELDPSLVARMPLLAPALNAPIPDSELTAGLDAELRHELLGSLVTDVLRHRTAAGPVALIVEDCQWADGPSRDLMIGVGRDVRHSHVVLAISSRTGEGDDDPLSWTRSLPDRTDVHLAPLAAADIERLARRTLRAEFGVRTAPDETLALLEERADGNPFVLEETLHLLRDRGIDPKDAEAVRVSALPDSLHSLVLARLDALGSDASATLKVASVIGRRFDASWLWKGFPDLGGQEEISRQLEHLRALDLVELDGARGQYRFRHAVVRDVAYETLSIAHRQDLHERVARMLEVEYADQIDRFVDLLAYHFGESRATDKQRMYFRKAAEIARAAYANEAAIAWFNRLLPLAEPAEASDVLREAGEVRQLSGDWTGAEEAFRDALVLAEREEDRLAAARARCSLGHLRTYTGSYGEARNDLEAAHATFEETTNEQGQLRTLEYLAFAAAEHADYDSSLAWSRQHLSLAERAGDAVATCMATEQAGLAHWHLGDYREARDQLERALATAERIRYVRGVILTANDLAGLSAEEGDHVEAFALVARALEAAREIGYHHAIGVLVGNAGELYRQHGDIERALASSSTGMARSAELGDRADVATKAGNIAASLLDAEMDAEAEPFLDAAEDLALLADDRYQSCECLQLRAELLTRRGQKENARKRNAEALAAASAIGRHDVLFAAKLLDIRLRHELGETDAMDALGAIVAISEREEAAIDYTAWEITADDGVRRRAAARYRSLHERVPNALYRRRYFDVTGERLPDPGPLPPLPGEDEGDLRLGEALQQAQQALRAVTRWREPAEGFVTPGSRAASANDSGAGASRASSTRSA